MDKTSKPKRQHPAKKFLDDKSLLMVSPSLLRLLRGDFVAAALLTRVVELNMGNEYNGDPFPMTDDEWADYLQCSTKTIKRTRKKLAWYGLEAKCGWSWLHFEPHVFHYKVDLRRLLETLGRSISETLFDQSDWPDWAKDKPTAEEDSMPHTSTELDTMSTSYIS